jgi:Fe2+ or Zn2+ uptake regulation protein
MKCEKCDSIISFESDYICKKIFGEAKKIWFKIKTHNIWVLWICKNCS